MLLQHHFWFNFTEESKNKLEQPTFINVIREPVSWFESHYNFALYGWERDAGKRKMNQGMKNMDLNDCILKEERICQQNSWRYLMFFSGEHIVHFNEKWEYQGRENVSFQSFREDEKIQIVEFTKRRILEDYLVVGVLEQFEDTLELFEYMMPRYYSGVLDVWAADDVQNTRNQTKSLNKKPLSDEALAKLK